MMIPSIVTAGPSVQTKNALRQASLAFYKQSGLEKDVKRLELRYVPAPVRKYGGWVTWGIGVYQKKMIVYKWEF